mmetsp:Transcript_33266/g.93274  ORF Transcript_33266/g.93274 Transcript_33266/m.93274 type:complete len:125 (-) Transcript_33266:1550-1924(-)
MGVQDTSTSFRSLCPGFFQAVVQLCGVSLEQEQPPVSLLEAEFQFLRDMAVNHWDMVCAADDAHPDRRPILAVIQVLLVLPAPWLLYTSERQRQRQRQRDGDTRTVWYEGGGNDEYTSSFSSGD